MGTVSITLNGVIYPKGRSANDVPIPATFIGEAWLTDVGVGGGPIIPPGQPPGIWGPPGPWPTPPINLVPQPPNGGAPPPDGADKPPPESGGWGFVAEWSQWGYFPGPTQAAPKG